MANRPDLRARNQKAAAVRLDLAQRRLERKMAGARETQGSVALPTLGEVRARLDAALARKGAAE